MRNKNTARRRCFCSAIRDSLRSRRSAHHVDGVRALFALGNLEGQHIANLQFIERNTLQILGVEEKVLRFAFARDETKSTIREGLDCSSHVDFYFVSASRNSTTSLS